MIKEALRALKLSEMLKCSRRNKIFLSIKFKFGDSILNTDLYMHLSSFSWFRELCNLFSEFIQSHIDFLDVRFIVFTHECINFHLKLLCDGLSIVDDFQSFKSCFECIFALSNHISQSLRLRLVFVFIHVENVFYFSFNSFVKRSRYSHLLS